MKTMRFSRILVTGGVGFIGSHIVDRLLAEGAEVTILDNLSNGYLANIAHHEGDSRVQIVVGDIRKKELLKRLLRRSDAVIHLAALVSLTRSFKDPVLTNEINATGTLHLLNACLDEGVSRIVYASSSTVYGNSESLPKDEDMAPRPSSPYAVSKMTGESYCLAFHQTYGLETACLRYFNVYGPRQNDDLYSGIIPVFISNLSEGNRPIIYGDGEQTRDFVYVDDVVEASLLALEKPGIGGEILNIGTGMPVSINQLTKTLNHIMNTSTEPKYGLKRSGDIRHTYANIEKAAKILGYSPKVTLEDGLREMIKLHMLRIQGYQ